MSCFDRMRNGIARFMYGRNGADHLCWFLLVVEIVLSLVASFLRNEHLATVFYYLTVVLWLLVLYRIFSRNLVKRRAENEKFLRWWRPISANFRSAKQRGADKAHKYVKCSCGTWCRVPRNVGKIEMTCPKCGKKRVVKT